jgi:sigma-B regulation protein RsbU (phosphoserine phosphatase)
MRILLVDDSEDSRDLTEGALLSAGYDDIVSAASGWEALKALDVGRTTNGDPPVDIVLLDIVMPEMDGVEVCARIRNDARYADMPIIMVTSLDDMNSLANAFVAGATDYVTKPVNRIELVARVRAALRLKQELDRRLARERELLAFLSSWGDRRAAVWIDEATGLFVGEVAEAYLVTCGCDAEELLSIFTLTLDRVDVDRTSGDETEKSGALVLVARAVRRIAATVGIVAAAYKNGMIVLVAPELGTKSARELAQTLHATVQKLRLPNPESVAADYVTASVAVVSGRARRDVDRVQMLTQAISSVQQAAAAGGNRVVALTVDGATAKGGKRISENLIHKKEAGATA